MVRRGRSASLHQPQEVPSSSPKCSCSCSSAAPPALCKLQNATAFPTSMFQQMAATAGGVAVGSAVGHAVGHGITSLLVVQIKKQH
ncbi:hypothetical protein EVAR_101347_1 [Eumeta japonica]|uniref:Uncharacterized protein n=1 Tax=Eumeta variegata TaxID=151549 RepID=A0A4C1SH63_EUMVA|nr:hypothetical protein EVAR_101347_1 [Eumeta japonica]